MKTLITEYIQAVRENEMTAIEAAAEMIQHAAKWAYPVDGYRTSDVADATVMRAIRAEFARLDKVRCSVPRPAVVAPTTKTCDCGHTISKTMVMFSSRGTSCPDCYDRMSN